MHFEKHLITTTALQKLSDFSSEPVKGFPPVSACFRIFAHLKSKFTTTYKDEVLL